MLRRGFRVASWGAAAAMTAAFAAGVLVPRLAGATAYTVLTGSMSPALPPGTLAVVRPVDAGQIGVGSVITYQLESGEPTVVTHRVVAQAVDGRGRPVFRTRGDANDAADPGWVRPVQVRGELWYSVPYLGHANAVVGGQVRRWGEYAAGALLLGYGASMLLGAYRDRSGRRRAPEPAHV